MQHATQTGGRNKTRGRRGGGIGGETKWHNASNAVPNHNTTAKRSTEGGAAHLNVVAPCVTTGHRWRRAGGCCGCRCGCGRGRGCRCRCRCRCRRLSFCRGRRRAWRRVHGRNNILGRRCSGGKRVGCDSRGFACDALGIEGGCFSGGRIAAIAGKVRQLPWRRRCLPGSGGKRVRSAHGLAPTSVAARASVGAAGTAPFPACLYFCRRRCLRRLRRRRCVRQRLVGRPKLRYPARGC